jgi:prolyl oligopeptidase PreP (S9A serine peptidase family)
VQKSGLIIVIFGLLIVTGLVVSIVENQTTLEGINQGNGKISSTETVTVSVDLDKELTPVGIFAIQVMEFKENTISIMILDPSNTEIISQKVNDETLEKEFDVFETGTYQLIIQSSDEDEIYVTGAICPLPDAGKKFVLSIISLGILIIGMTGLATVGIIGIRNRKKSV